MTNLVIEPREQARIDNLGLMVSMHGPDYVVRHPSLKRRKHEGGNLSALITAIEMDLDASKAKNPPAAAKNKTQPKPSIVGKGSDVPPRGGLKTVAKPADPKPASPLAEGKGEDQANESAGPAAKAGRRKKASAAKPKRQQSDWKTYAVGKLILENASMTPDEIMTLCKTKGIETKTGTVYGLHRYFNLCVRIMADLAEEKAKKKPA